MPNHFIDLIGRRFGRLLVIKRSDNTNLGHSRWVCKCDCGIEKECIGFLLRNGDISSCGCYRREKRITHGDSNSNLYYIWIAMKGRCFNKKSKDFRLYGMRGISICDEWRSNYTYFMEWALRNGYGAGLSIDRINNDGNYEPSNCRWATPIQQANNKRNNVKAPPIPTTSH
jgi:hypothetical protein